MVGKCILLVKRFVKHPLDSRVYGEIYTVHDQTLHGYSILTILGETAIYKEECLLLKKDNKLNRTIYKNYTIKDGYLIPDNKESYENN